MQSLDIQEKQAQIHLNLFSFRTVFMFGISSWVYEPTSYQLPAQDLLTLSSLRTAETEEREREKRRRV